MNFHFVYILFSKSANSFYVGETKDLESRLTLHNLGTFKGSFTKRAKDWILYYSISCNSRKQARLIESHIKKMKSRKYLSNLKAYPEMTQKLLTKYS